VIPDAGLDRSEGAGADPDLADRRVPGVRGECHRRRHRSDRLQVSRARVASGFPPDVRVAAKSGSLMGVVRNEAAVVTDPDGRSWGVAVFTRADRTYERRAEIDGSIGGGRRLAVASLRAAT